MSIKALKEASELLRGHDGAINVQILRGVIAAIMEPEEADLIGGWRLRQVDFQDSNRPSIIYLESKDGELIRFRKDD